MTAASHTACRLKLAKLGVFALCALPAVWLLQAALRNELGANPLEALMHGTGEWALKMLLVTLAVTPLRRATGWRWLLAFRRMFGLFAFAYGVLHFLVWAWLDKRWHWSVMLEDVIERPFLTVGFLALLLLVPLALTSSRGMMRRLGRNWQRLHRVVYVVAALGVWHFVWLVKADWLEPAVYGVILAVLFATRHAGIRRHLQRLRSLRLFPA